MESWEEQVQLAVAAGERKFGFLDGHQTLRRNLVRRCEELLAEEPQTEAAEHSSLLPAGDTD